MKRHTDWAMHIEAQSKSGLSIQKYCDLHKISVSNFYARRSALHKKAKKPDFVPVVPKTKPATNDNGFELHLTFDDRGFVKISGTLPDLKAFKDLLGGPL